MKKGKCDWVIIKTDVQPAIQKCLHCGEEERMPFDKPIDYAVDIMKVFIKHHKKCKPPVIAVFDSIGVLRGEGSK